MNAKRNWMLQVYSQNLDGVWFSVALAKEQIVVSAFRATQQEALAKILEALPFGVPFQVFHEPSAHAKTILARLKSLYDGKRVDTDFSLALQPLPVYTQKILKATMQIPLGYVTTYGALARAAGGGARAVGNVMASNPFAPIVPCHRVVKSDFTLGGYGLGGLKVKVELLAKEKQGFAEPKQIAVNGRQLVVFPAEFALKSFANRSLFGDYVDFSCVTKY